MVIIIFLWRLSSVVNRARRNKTGQHKPNDLLKTGHEPQHKKNAPKKKQRHRDRHEEQLNFYPWVRRRLRVDS